MLRTVNVAEILEKEVVRFGNGSIVYTPKKWIGQKVLVILEEKPVNVAEEVLRVLKSYLSEIEGIYLYGSFARNEQTENSDIDVLVISDKKIGLMRKGRFEFTITSKQKFVELLKKDGVLFLYQMVKEAKPILNKTLLEEFRKVEIKPDFERFFSSTLTAFKNAMKLLGDDKKRGKIYTESTASIYSLILRLKTMFLIQCYLKKQSFSSKKFKEFIGMHGFNEKTINDFVEVYRAERDNKPIVRQILLVDVEKLFDAAKIEFLKTEELVKK